METVDEEFSPQESLKIIRHMIETTKHSISDNSHFFLLWGWATLAGCLLQYYLMEVVHYQQHYFAWFVTPIALLLHVLFLTRNKQKAFKSFIGEANKYIWQIVGFSYLALAIIFIKIGWQYCFPFYIMLYSIGTYISGSILQFKPMRIAGAFCLLFAAITPYLPYGQQILLCAFAILVSYIIPGHILRNHYIKINK